MSAPLFAWTCSCGWSLKMQGAGDQTGELFDRLVALHHSDHPIDHPIDPHMSAEETRHDRRDRVGGWPE